MATSYTSLVTKARVLLSDMGTNQDWTSTNITDAMSLVNAFLKYLGYDKSHTSDTTSVTPTLTEKEEYLWARATAILLMHPKAFRVAAMGISIRTGEVSYTTKSGVVMDLKANIDELRMLIAGGTTPIASSTTDFGLVLPDSSTYQGLDPYR